MLNKPELWIPKDFQHAKDLVGGPKREEHDLEGQCVANSLSKYVSNGHKILDYGCGYGRITRYLKEVTKNQGKKCLFHCVDFNQDMLDYAKKYIENSSEINFSLSTSGITVGSIDFVFTHAVLIHNSPEQVLSLFSEFNRLLKLGGSMIHDFLNGDKEEGRRQSFDALNISFPLYAYTKDQISLWAKQTGFSSVLVGKSDVRNPYLFVKTRSIK